MPIQKDKVIAMVEKLSNFRGFETLPAKIREWDANYVRNAANEARLAKKQREKEIKDAVDAALKEISDSYQRFYITEDKYESRNLKMYTASEKSLGMLPSTPCSQRNSTLASICSCGAGCRY